jgi:hypothetical protein
MSKQSTPTKPAAATRWAAWLGATVLLALLAGWSWWNFFSRPRPQIAEPSPKTPDHAPSVAAQATPTGPAWFRDATAASGIDFTNRNGEEADQFTILETLGGGVALIDFDGDQLLDLFFVGGGYFDGPDKQSIKGHPCRFFRNLGQGKFEELTRQVGFERPWWYTQGAAVADYDRDGWPDLLVTGYGKLALYHNEPADQSGRRFVDVTEQVGLADDSWSTSAGWGDLDGDGFPDLYVCHYVDWSFANNPLCKGNTLGVERETCGPERFRPLVHALFRNEKGTAFRNVSQQHGFQASGCGLGVLLADLNADSRPDVYVANDMNNNFLYYNRGGKLEEQGVQSGVAADETGRADGSMGVDAADFDGSGRPSIWVTNFQSQVHALYLNLGRELFNHHSRAVGVAALGQGWVGFGTGFMDVDNDGWEDVVVANGHVWRQPPRGSRQQRPVLLQNVDRDGQRFLVDAGERGGPFFGEPRLGRGVAIGDLDNDGWPDLVVSHMNHQVALLHNQAAESLGKPRHWLGLRLVGRDRRDVVGSTVVVETGTRSLTRFVKGGGSYLSANDPRILVGLGESTRADRVTVRWSWGEEQSWEDLAPDCYWELHEGVEKAERLGN